MREAAEGRYPNQSRDDALLAYVKEEKIKWVFFPDEQGQRCVWGRGRLSLAFSLDI